MDRIIAIRDFVSKKMKRKPKHATNMATMEAIEMLELELQKMKTSNQLLRGSLQYMIKISVETKQEAVKQQQVLNTGRTLASEINTICQQELKEAQLKTAAANIVNDVVVGALLKVVEEQKKESRDEREKLKSVIDRKDTELSAMTQELGTAETHIMELRHENDALKQSLQHANQEVDKGHLLQKELERVSQHQRDELKHVIDQKDSRITELKHELKVKLEEKDRRRRDTVKKMKEEIGSQDMTITSLQDELLLLKQQAEVSKAEHDRLQAEMEMALQKLQTEKDQLDTSLKQAQERVEKLGSDLEDSSKVSLNRLEALIAGNLYSPKDHLEDKPSAEASTSGAQPEASTSGAQPEASTSGAQPEASTSGAQPEEEGANSSLISGDAKAHRTSWRDDQLEVVLDLIAKENNAVTFDMTSLLIEEIKEKKTIRRERDTLLKKLFYQHIELNVHKEKLKTCPQGEAGRQRKDRRRKRLHKDVMK